jgi:hypothetical protein
MCQKITKSVETLVSKREELAAKASSLAKMMQGIKDEQKAIDAAIIDRLKFQEGGRAKMTHGRVLEIKRVDVAERTQTVKAYSFYRFAVIEPVAAAELPEAIDV